MKAGPESKQLNIGDLPSMQATRSLSYVQLAVSGAGSRIQAHDENVQRKRTIRFGFLSNNLIQDIIVPRSDALLGFMREWAYYRETYAECLRLSHLVILLNFLGGEQCIVQMLWSTSTKNICV